SCAQVSRRAAQEIDRTERPRLAAQRKAHERAETGRARPPPPRYRIVQRIVLDIVEKRRLAARGDFAVDALAGAVGDDLRGELRRKAFVNLQAQCFGLRIEQVNAGGVETGQLEHFVNNLAQHDVRIARLVYRSGDVVKRRQFIGTAYAFLEKARFLNGRSDLV